MSTHSISSFNSPLRLTTSSIANPPSWGALKFFNAPPNFPMGVRAASTITTFRSISFLLVCLPKTKPAQNQSMHLFALVMRIDHEQGYKHHHFEKSLPEDNARA
jgi:hypothetical protein